MKKLIIIAIASLSTGVLSSSKKETAQNTVAQITFSATGFKKDLASAD